MPLARTYDTSTSTEFLFFEPGCPRVSYEPEDRLNPLERRTLALQKVKEQAVALEDAVINQLVGPSDHLLRDTLLHPSRERRRITAVDKFFHTNTEAAARQMLGKLREQEQYYSARIAATQAEVSKCAGLLKALTVSRMEQQAKREKTMQMALLSDLLLEKRLRVEALDEVKQHLGRRLAKMVATRIRRTTTVPPDQLGETEPGRQQQQGEDQRQSDDEEEEDEDVVNQRFRALLASRVFPELEKLWGECLQVPQKSSFPSVVAAVTEREGDGGDHQQQPLLIPALSPRRTAGGGIDACIAEEDGWVAVRRAIRFARYLEHPYYSLFGGATEDHLSSRPLHTFLKALRKVRSDAFIAEEILRSAASAPPPPTVVTEDCFQYFKSVRELCGSKFTEAVDALETKWVIGVVYAGWRRRLKEFGGFLCLLLQRGLLLEEGEATAAAAASAEPGDGDAAMQVKLIQLEWYRPLSDDEREQRKLKLLTKSAAASQKDKSPPTTPGETFSNEEDDDSNCSEPGLARSSSGSIGMAREVDDVVVRHLFRCPLVEYRQLQKQQQQQQQHHDPSLSPSSSGHHTAAPAAAVGVSLPSIQLTRTSVLRTAEVVGNVHLNQYMGCREVAPVVEELMLKGGGVVQSAVTFSPQAFERRQRAERALRAERERVHRLHEELADILEDVYTLEQQCAALEEEAAATAQ